MKGRTRRFCLWLLGIWGVFGWLFVPEIQAAIKESDVFLDANWNYEGETTVIQDSGGLQAVCVTDDYLICLENFSNRSSAPDTLIAFYKNPYDENGNPVEQYSYAKHITEMDYEHGNGMTYDPTRDEILIAGGKALNPENKGCVYVVDGTTLKFKRKLQVTKEGRAAAIDYWKDRDLYVLMVGSDDDETFHFQITDKDFHVLDSFGGVDNSAGNTFQDFCISGDYIISIPFMKRTGREDTLQVYSLTEKRLVGTYGLQLENEADFVEPESICEIEPGKLLIGTFLTDPRRIAFYSTRVESAFSVTTQVEHGTVTSSQKVVDQGTDFTVKYTPDENYELSRVVVDGQELDIEQYPYEYVFPDLQENHRIDIFFTPIPAFTVTTSVSGGTISESVTALRGGEAAVSYAPKEHYELSEILLDGVSVPVEGKEEEYRLEDLQGDHTLEVIFTEAPQFSITAEAVNGVITPAFGSVYRGESLRVEYRGKPGFSPAHLLIDGVEQEDVTLEELAVYEFQNVTEPHSIRVVYQWKYLPLVILSVFWLAAWVIAMQALKLERRRRRIRKKRERLEDRR